MQSSFESKQSTSLELVTLAMTQDDENKQRLTHTPMKFHPLLPFSSDVFIFTFLPYLSLEEHTNMELLSGNHDPELYQILRLKELIAKLELAQTQICRVVSPLMAAALCCCSLSSIGSGMLARQYFHMREVDVNDTINLNQTEIPIARQAEEMVVGLTAEGMGMIAVAVCCISSYGLYLWRKNPVLTDDEVIKIHPWAYNVLMEYNQNDPIEPLALDARTTFHDAKEQIFLRGARIRFFVDFKSYPTQDLSYRELLRQRKELDGQRRRRCEVINADQSGGDDEVKSHVIDINDDSAISCATAIP